MPANHQHRRGDVPGDRLGQQVGELGERAHHSGVVLVAPPCNEARGQEEDDRLWDRQPQWRQEELAFDPVAAAPRLEDRYAQLGVEGVDVAIHGPGRHPGQAGDLAHLNPVLTASGRIEDGGNAQEARKAIALAADPLVTAAGLAPALFALERRHRGPMVPAGT